MKSKIYLLIERQTLTKSQRQTYPLYKLIGPWKAVGLANQAFLHRLGELMDSDVNDVKDMLHISGFSHHAE